MTSNAIVARSLAIADSMWFAQQSEDWNPIHVSPEAARRLLTGGVVVHGMHSLLWTLEQHFAQGGESLAGATATFLKPIYPDMPLTLYTAHDEDGAWIELRNGEEVAATFRFRSGASEQVAVLPQRHKTGPREPKPLSFPDMKGAAGAIVVDGQADALVAHFPRTVAALGGLRVAGIMALSRLVGMECPGLHSLLSGVDLTFDTSGPELQWHVTRHGAPAAPLGIAVNGAGLSGTIAAFVRPPPVTQPAMLDIAAHTLASEFAAQRALIIGGSRGLGEVVAKIISAGGGACTITYHSGRMDAQRVADDIKAAGGRCDILPFDAENAEDGEIQDLIASSPTHIYYFATPRIGGRSAQVFDPAIARRFYTVYVEAFGRLCLAAAAMGPVKAFNPSTTYVEELPRDHVEYVIAKAAGEALCALLNRHTALGILSARLPRLETDQTAGLLAKPVGKPLPYMLDIVRRLQTFEK